nr:hypothetical protein [Homoserinimonas sp. OAct 916]
MIVAIIIACEVGFWVLVVAGLVARYVLRRPRLGAWLLAMTLVVDLVLLTAVIVNLQAGGTATFFHGLAAVYFGVSIAYGRKMIGWADSRFAHRFAGGPAPVKLAGAAYGKERRHDVVRTVCAVAIAAGILWLLTTLVADANSTDELLHLYPLLGIWFAADLAWAIWYTVVPKSRPAVAR